MLSGSLQSCPTPCNAHPTSVAVYHIHQQLSFFSYDYFKCCHIRLIYKLLMVYALVYAPLFKSVCVVYASTVYLAHFLRANARTA